MANTQQFQEYQKMIAEFQRSRSSLPLELFLRSLVAQASVVIPDEEWDRYIERAYEAGEEAMGWGVA